MADRRDTGETFGFVAGLMAGFLLSAPIAAWLAPRSGAQVRETITQRGMIIRRRVGGTVRRPVEQVQQQIASMRGESIEDALDEGRALAAQRQTARRADD